MINHNMNIRSGPGTSYPIIGNASPGQEFPITGANPAGDWWRIAFSDQDGWVFGQLVTANNVEGRRISTVFPSPTPRPTSVPFFTIASLHNRIRKNEILFENEFKGKYVKVRGKVLSVRLEMSDTEIWIDLEHIHDVWSTFGVTCRMSPDFAQKAMSIESGDTITVGGTVGDKFITQDLDNCLILSQ